jgi:hypothetical protein
VGGGIISNCFATGNVTSGDQAGGLVMHNYGTITNCYATGKVKSNGSDAGGLVGINQEVGVINYCYASGDVYGYTRNAGGLAAQNYGTIRNSAAAGSSTVSHWSSALNRISGRNGVGSIRTNNYANSGMWVESVVDDPAFKGDGSDDPGISQTMATLKSRSFYATASNWHTKAWDMTEVWDIKDGQGLPFLRGSVKTGIEKNSQPDNAYKVYPNPCSDYFIIDFDRLASLKLHDMLGREVHAQTINGETEINISRLPKGIYVISIISDGKMIGNSKIVKQ